MVYLIEHKDKKGNPKTSAIVSAFFSPHALDMYEFVVKIEEEDIVEVYELGEGFVDRPVYIEVNRFDEFLGYSLEAISPSKKGNEIREIIVTDTITNVYKITNNTILK